MSSKRVGSKQAAVVTNEATPDAQTSPKLTAPSHDFHGSDSHSFVCPMDTHCLVQPLEWSRFVAGCARTGTLGAIGIAGGVGTGFGYRGHHGVGGTIRPALVCSRQRCNGFGAFGPDHGCLGAGPCAVAFPLVALGRFDAQRGRSRRQPVGAEVLATLHPPNPLRASRLTCM